MHILNLYIYLSENVQGYAYLIIIYITEQMS